MYIVHEDFVKSTEYSFRMHGITDSSQRYSLYLGVSPTMLEVIQVHRRENRLGFVGFVQIWRRDGRMPPFQGKGTRSNNPFRVCSGGNGNMEQQLVRPVAPAYLGFGQVCQGKRRCAPDNVPFVRPRGRNYDWDSSFKGLVIGWTKNISDSEGDQSFCSVLKGTYRRMKVICPF